MDRSPRFDTGHELDWTYGGVMQWTSGIGDGVVAFFTFVPETDFDMVRVDYASVVLNFASLDLSATAILYIGLGEGGPLLPFLATSVGGPTNDTHPASCAQLTLPFVSLGFTVFAIDGVSAGTSTSSITATLGLSFAHTRPTTAAIIP